MPSTPVDDHTQEFEQLAGLMALDILDGDERLRFEQHAATCERCRVIVRLDREALARATPEMDPSPGFRQRVLERARVELAATAPAPEPIPVGRMTNVVPFWRRSRWVTALAAVVVIALVSVGALSYENQVVASYALQGSVSGSALVEVRRNGSAELDLRGLTNPPPGFLYEAWVIPEGGKPIPVGVAATGDARLPLNSVSNGATVALTQEQTRVDAPTGSPVMAVVIQL